MLWGPVEGSQQRQNDLWVGVPFLEIMEETDKLRSSLDSPPPIAGGLGQAWGQESRVLGNKWALVSSGVKPPLGKPCIPMISRTAWVCVDLGNLRPQSFVVRLTEAMLVPHPPRGISRKIPTRPLGTNSDSNGTSSLRRGIIGIRCYGITVGCL